MAQLVPKPVSEETALVAWLCIMRHNLSNSGEGLFFVPNAVRDGLCARGWCTVSEPDDDGNRQIHVTDKGCIVSDLAAPEWMIDPIPEG